MQSSLLQELFLKPLKSQKRRFAVILPALAMLSAADGSILLMIRGFTKALFQASVVRTVPLLELLPAKAQTLFPSWGGVDVERGTLALAVPAIILVAGFAKALASYLYQVNQQALALFMAKSYREKLFQALLSLPYVEIRRRPAGEWMSLIMNDVLLMQNRFTDIMTVLVKHTVTVVTGFAMLTFVHWPTALIILAISPVIAFGMGRTGKRIARYAEVFQRELSYIAGSVLDLRGRFDFIRAQRGEVREQQRFQKQNLSYYLLIRRSILVRSAFAPALEFLGFAIFAAAVYAIGSGLLGGFTPDLMMTFFVALGLMLRPLREIGEQLSRYHENRGVLENSLSTFRRLGELAKLAAAKAAPGATLSPRSGLSIRTIRAGMAGETRFKGKNLELAPGRAVAIIGPSGAGKSTLLKTLAGLVEPLEWDADCAWEEAAGRMSMVSQDPFLFDDSIGQNLTYGLSDAALPQEDELWRALATVNIDQEVRALDAGLATRLRAIGSNVSGGQLQRLVIARGLLRQKSIWLLDEATSAVDARSERDITQRLIQACHESKHALVAVTHRLTWLGSFDEVWFVEHGERTLVGPHAELLATPRYRDYCMAHAGAAEA